MLSVRRPSLLNRALTTPPQTPRTVDPEAMVMQTDQNARLLTPPLSPRGSRSSSDLFSLDDMSISPTSPLPLTSKQCLAQPEHDTGTLVCPFGVELIQDGRGGSQMFGSGAWSEVFKAAPVKIQTATNRFGLMTPPASPTMSTPVIVAVKRPRRSDAKPILKNEAAILSHLNRLSSKGGPIVTFYGMIEADCSLVLGATPLSLQDHLRCCAISSEMSLTTSNMSLPVLGSTSLWLSLAHELVSALLWLHDRAEVVHGDIKPGNFLLEPRGTLNEDEFPFRPLFIDFSSSRRTGVSENDIPTGTLSAVTMEYTAPELLKSSVLCNPKSTATKASDVFSLAITLLVAATGNLMVYDGIPLQRQAMARQGWQAIGIARCGASCSRIPKQGIVERALEKAVLKHDMGRITAAKWLAVLQDMQKGGPTKASLKLA